MTVDASTGRYNGVSVLNTWVDPDAAAELNQPAGNPTDPRFDNDIAAPGQNSLGVQASTKDPNYKPGPGYSGYTSTPPTSVADSNQVVEVVESPKVSNTWML